MEQLILETMSKVAEMLDLELSKIDHTTILLDSGLDSMAFAMLVVELEEALGFDPFQIEAEVIYPETFKELLDIYEQHGK